MSSASQFQDSRGRSNPPNGSDHEAKLPEREPLNVKIEWLLRPNLYKAAEPYSKCRGLNVIEGRQQLETFAKNRDHLVHLALNGERVFAVMGMRMITSNSSTWGGIEKGGAKFASEFKFLDIDPDFKDNSELQEILFLKLHAIRSQRPLLMSIPFSESSLIAEWDVHGFRQIEGVQGVSPAEHPSDLVQLKIDNGMRAEGMTDTDLFLFNASHHDDRYLTTALDPLLSEQEKKAQALTFGVKVTSGDKVVGLALLRHSSSALVIEYLVVAKEILADDTSANSVMQLLSRSIRSYARGYGANQIYCRYFEIEPKLSAALEASGFTLYSNHMAGNFGATRVEADRQVEKRFMSSAVIEPKDYQIGLALQSLVLHRHLPDVPPQIWSDLPKDMKAVIENTVCSKSSRILVGKIGHKVSGILVFDMKGDTVSLLCEGYVDKNCGSEEDLQKFMLKAFEDYLSAGAVDKISFAAVPWKPGHTLGSVIFRS